LVAFVSTHVPNKICSADSQYAKLRV